MRRRPPRGHRRRAASRADLRRSLVGEKADAGLAGVEVHGQTITVSSAGVPATFVFIGQDGVVRKTADQVMHASYELQAADTYIRTVIRTANMVMYLNPISATTVGRCRWRRRRSTSR